MVLKDLINQLIPKKALQKKRIIILLKISKEQLYQLKETSEHKKIICQKTTNLFLIIMTKDQHFTNRNPIIRISL